MENPPSVNKENSSCRFFHVMIGASAGAPPIFLFLCYFLLSFLSRFSSWRERGAGAGDLSIGLSLIHI